MADALEMHWFTHAKYHEKRGNFDLLNDEIKVMLCTNAFTPNKNGMEFRDEITNEVVATGYAAGGQALINVTLTVVDNTVVLDSDDLTWNITGTLTSHIAVLYVNTGTPETDILLGYAVFDGDESVTDGPYTLIWNASGILRDTIS